MIEIEWPSERVQSLLDAIEETDADWNDLVGWINKETE